MAQVHIEKLGSDISEGMFNCGNPTINRQIQESYFPTILQHAYAYQVVISGRVVAYYMIKLRTVKLSDAPEEIKDYSSSLISDCGAVHIKYIAVATEYQKQSIGTNVLKAIIMQVSRMCQQLPITILTLDALTDKYEWYKKNGFSAFNEKELEKCENTIPMYMNCILDMNAVYNYSDSMV